MAHPPRIGRTFGRLTVLDMLRPSDKPDGNHTYRCRCSCGTVCEGRWKNLTKGHKKSCGCLYAENLAQLKAVGAATRAAKSALAAARPAPRHPARHPAYKVWANMIARCSNPNHYAYRFYGAKGITVADEWLHDFWVFAADMGDRPDGTTLDRVCNATGYSKGNCRWATKVEQYSNSRVPAHLATIHGKTQCVTDWARQLGFRREGAMKLIRHGLSPEVSVIAAWFRKQKWEARTPGAWTNYAACIEEAKAWLVDS